LTWVKDIRAFEPRHLVSSMGRVRQYVGAESQSFGRVEKVQP
jgi:hypothetical protein